KKTKKCKDCGAGTKRKASYPGPRCYSHHRARVAQLKNYSHAQHIADTYGGLTADEYQQMYEHQHGTCAHCRRATGKTRRLAVDHDHVTGLVRGLLCKSCNRYLGHARYDPMFYARAIDYLNNPTAKQLGIERYGETK